MTLYNSNEVLRLLRISHDLTRKELSKKTDLSPAFITELEKGNRNPSIDTLKKYSSGLNIPLDTITYLLENNNSKLNFQELLITVLKKISSK